MNDESRSLNVCSQVEEFDWIDNSPSIVGPASPVVPDYLQETYWWAYLHPNSFWFFEREWVVNLILWGNMKRLTEAVLQEASEESGTRVLQLACVYGEFSKRLANKLDQTRSHLDIVDVAPIQLSNARRKLKGNKNTGFLHYDSSALNLSDASYDQTVVFFLLHEQPDEVRRKTVSEAIRVTRPGGKIVFVDYHGPRRLNPLRYLMRPLLIWLEPFALDMWENNIADWVPAGSVSGDIQNQQYFGGLYQKVVFIRS